MLGFALGGEGHRFLGGGWWFPESHGIWQRSARATVVLPLETMPAAGAPLWLDLLVHAPLGPQRPEVAVRVVVNDRTVARATLAGPGVVAHELRARVPAVALRGTDVAELAVIVDRTMSPADARLNSDGRQLGVGLIALRLGADEAREPLAAA